MLRGNAYYAQGTALGNRKEVVSKTVLIHDLLDRLAGETDAI
jgi:hypothetical protein